MCHQTEYLLVAGRARFYIDKTICILYVLTIPQVTTRALGVVGGTKLLVPVVDMANHEAGSPHVVDRDGDAVVLRIGADVPAGSEVAFAWACQQPPTFPQSDTHFVRRHARDG